MNSTKLTSKSVSLSLPLKCSYYAWLTKSFSNKNQKKKMWWETENFYLPRRNTSKLKCIFLQRSKNQSFNRVVSSEWEREQATHTNGLLFSVHFSIRLTLRFSFDWFFKQWKQKTNEKKISFIASKRTKMKQKEPK